MMPLSNDLRERILAAVDNREGSRRQIAARFRVNVSTITRLLQLRHQTGSLDPRPDGGGKPLPKPPAAVVTLVHLALATALAGKGRGTIKTLGRTRLSPIAPVLHEAIERERSAARGG